MLREEVLDVQGEHCPVEGGNLPPGASEAGESSEIQPICTRRVLR